LPVLLKQDRPHRPGHATGVETPTPVARTLAANHDRFLRFLERRVGRRDLAEEILQDAFVRGLARADSIQQTESAIAWFYRLLRNALVDHHRRQDSERRALQAVASEAQPAVPLDEELMTTVCTCVDDLLGTLKPEYAQAIRQVDMHGASVTAFAEQIGITPGNAGVRIHRARQALKRRVEESCGTCAEHACLDCQCKAAPAPP